MIVGINVVGKKDEFCFTPDIGYDRMVMVEGGGNIGVVCTEMKRTPSVRGT